VLTGTHAILYAGDSDAARAFFRDVLELPYVDTGGGWLIFRLPPAEIGVHPPDGDAAPSGRHELFLTCDDIEATVADLRGKGAEFDGGITEQGWGRLVTMLVPGGGRIGLYQPKHLTPPG
jgi:predicted enzyme related to lactoylglutathione lyase